jgi:hypothetical protein
VIGALRPTRADRRFSTTTEDANNMKRVLRDAWLAQTDQKTRTFLEIAYVHLSQFQDGVGDKPIDCKLPSDADPEKKMAVLEPYLRFSSAVTEEAESLRAS